MLVLQASHALSDERTEFLIKDRLSFMRFLGLGLADPVPDANTIWTFREALTRAQIEGKPAIAVLFAAYEGALRRAGYLAMGGQIIDAVVIAAPKQRNTEAEKAAIKAGTIPEAWNDKPAKLAQKDRDARWTMKFSKANMRTDPVSPAPRVEVITSVQRRRRWFTAEKVRLVEETAQPGSSVSFVARRYGISPSLLFCWKRRMVEGGPEAAQADEDVVGTSRVRELERRVRDLERLLGRKTMEVEILKEALDLARAKKPTWPLMSWSDQVGASRRRWSPRRWASPAPT